MRTSLIICSLLFMGLSLSACSVNPATGEQSFTGLMSSEKEIQVGRAEHPKILQQFGGAYEEGSIHTYVNDLGQRLARVSELPDLKWTFTILDDPIINAFALPGGYIYVSRGLLTLAENEAELAAVLGHEIGHVTARHTAQRYSQSVLTGLGANILGIVVGSPAGNLASLAGNAYLASYSRAHEMEADALGIRYMTKLGYDPKAATTFFRKLARHTELQARIKGQRGQQGHYSIFASHPDTQKRIEATSLIASQYPSDVDLINRPVFLSQIQGIEFGPSTRQGIIDKQSFIHPPLRFRFDVPQDFDIVNKPAYVAAVHTNKSALIFEMRRNTHGDLPIKRYVQEVWAKKYNLRDLQNISVDRLPAATGVTRIQTKEGTRDLRYLAIQDGDEIFKFRFLSPPEHTDVMDLPFRQTAYSFKRLSYREAQGVRGQQIGLHRVGRGETLTALSQRMAVEKLPEDWFGVLNKEALSDGLQAGETVKLVVR